MIKCISFGDFNKFYKSRKLLKKWKNEKNDRHIFQKFPKIDAELKNKADKQGFITSRNNCKVSVLLSKANNTISYHRINYTGDLATVANAIKRKNASKKRKSEKDNDGKSICSPDIKRVNQQ